MYRAKVASWLLAMIMLALLPLVVFTLYSIEQFADLQQRHLTVELAQRTEAMASDVRVQLAAAAGALNTLASSEEARDGDLHGLYDRAVHVAATTPGVAAITLVTPDRRMVFITRRAFGTQGLRGSDPASLDAVFRTGHPAVSGPFKSPISNREVYTVGVPVVENGKVAYCLRMAFLTSSLDKLLAAQHLPSSWTAVIVDKDGRILARSLNADRYVGRLAAPSLIAALRNPLEREFHGTTCVFRPIVTDRSGIVTGDSGIVTDRSGIVTGGAWRV